MTIDWEVLQTHKDIEEAIIIADSWSLLNLIINFQFLIDDAFFGTLKKRCNDLIKQHESGLPV